MFEAGTKVKLISSGKVGTIVERMDEDLWRLRLDDNGMDMLAFKDELIRCMDQPNLQAQKAKTPIDASPANEVEKPVGGSPSNKGVFLLFEPIVDYDQVPVHFVVWLINDTSIPFIFDGKLNNGQEAIWHTNDIIGDYEYVELQELDYQVFQESPVYGFHFTVELTDGEQYTTDFLLKLKPKFFQKKIQEGPLLQREGYLFPISIDKPKKSASKEDLKTYTKKNLRYITQSQSKSGYYNGVDISAYAAFKPEIDLHLEALNEDGKNKPTKHILELQLIHFEQFMEKAIRFGVDQVFIIHGVGAGTLKKAISERLDRMPEVVDYKNEFHPLYGFGATEVFLG